MSDYLARENAPLTVNQWRELDQMVVQVARANLVGRRFIPIFGPFGVGLQTIPQDNIEGMSRAEITMSGEPQGERLGSGQREYRRLPILQKDFQVHWRDVESSQQLGTPFDLSLAAASAAFVAQAEDQMIFHGDQAMGIPGLLHAPGRTQIAPGNYDEAGSIFQTVVKATEALTSQGFYGPYALVLSPKLYALANRVHPGTAVLEIEQVEKLVSGGIFRSAILTGDQAVLVSTGPQNMDLAVAQDLTTAYLDVDNMNHVFRVFEILTLRVKRPGAICTFDSK